MSQIGPESFAVLYGVLAGGVVTIGSTVLIELIRERRHSKQIAMAFCGEISALQEIVNRRGYRDNLQEVIEYIESSGKRFTFRVRVTREYFKVYEENIGKIGSLNKDVALRIPGFYVKANSILEDLKSLDEGILDSMDVNDQLEYYKELMAMFNEAMDDASRLTSCIKERYS